MFVNIQGIEQSKPILLPCQVYEEHCKRHLSAMILRYSEGLFKASHKGDLSFKRVARAVSRCIKYNLGSPNSLQKGQSIFFCEYDQMIDVLLLSNP